MISVRPSISFPDMPLANVTLAITAVAVILGVGITAPAFGQDNIGIFWDSSYTQDSTTTGSTSFPEILTGYLVLKDPSISSGLSGWECCVEVDGPGQFLSWTLDGQGTNFTSSPCFKVGISGPPLSSQGDALLATFQIMVTEYQPVALSLRPDFNASLPGQMSFIPADDPGTALPMTTMTGQPEVAWINPNLVGLVVDPVVLHFDNILLGTQVVQAVTVSNPGINPGNLDIDLTGGCAPFSLPGLSGPVTVPAGESISIDVAFLPQTTESFLCDLNLGGGLPEVPMAGSGREPVVSWQAPTNLFFGTIGYGQSKTLDVIIINNGDLEFTIEPHIPCPEFVIAYGGSWGAIPAGSSRRIGIEFTPTAPDTHNCQLELGSLLPPVQLSGIGGDPVSSWVISPSALDFGQRWVDSTKELWVTIQNTGDLPVPVVPTVADTCSGFSAISGSFSINPGTSGSVIVGFSPPETGEYACTLDLGDVLPDVPLFGTASDSVAWEAPTYHDFGLVGVGIEKSFFLVVTNTGSFPFEVVFTLPDTAQSFFRPPLSFTLNPGQSRTTTPWFKPVVPGHHSVVMDLGDVLPPILLEGDGDPRPAEFSVAPTSIDYGWHFLGDTKYGSVSINNTGGTFLELAVGLDDENLGFTITNGIGGSQLPPGDRHLVQILFQPEVAGVFTTDLNLGPMIAPVPITGSAESTEGICISQIDTLVFGPINAGGSQTLSYSVTNDSHQDLSINPNTNNSPIFLANGGSTISPGQTQSFDLNFQPQLPVNYSGTLTLNSRFCSDITLIGTATPPVGIDQNLVGIFFDPAFSIIDTKTYQSNQIVEGYLVMLNPSETSGVGSWELEVDIEGDAQWLGWNIEGQHINVGSYNEFIVGIGGSPLPYGPDVLLATGYLMVTQPYPNLVNLELKPIWNASIPGQMAWGPWHDATMLMPLIPLTGQSIVAGVNWDSASAVETPTPVATTRLLPNVPNPFNPMTEIRFELDRPQQVRVTVYDVTGRLVKVLSDGHMEAGSQTRIWQGRVSGGRQVPSGVYYVRMVAGDMIDHRKIMLLK